MPVKPTIYVWEHEFLPVGKVYNVVVNGVENSIEFSKHYYDILEKYNNLPKKSIETDKSNGFLYMFL